MVGRRHRKAFVHSPAVLTVSATSAFFARGVVRMMRNGRLLSVFVGVAGSLLCLDRGASGDIDGGATVAPPLMGPESPAEHEARIRAALVAKPIPGLQLWPRQLPPLVKAYIARIHRPIHRRWGFGALVAWNKLPPADPFNNQTLSTVLEIVLDGNGFVERLAIAEPSRLPPFDTAAIETVLSAAPFGPPPQEMIAADGRAYLRWGFHRDDRACGIDGVEFFTASSRMDRGSSAGLILAKPPVEPSRLPSSETSLFPLERAPRRTRHRRRRGRPARHLSL